jgi:hypothetical protein
MKRWRVTRLKSGLDIRVTVEPLDPARVALAFRVHRHGPSSPTKADNGERFMFSGSNTEIIDDLRAMSELGVKAIDFNFGDLTVDAMRQFHEEVVAKSP